MVEADELFGNYFQYVSVGCAMAHFGGHELFDGS